MQPCVYLQSRIPPLSCRQLTDPSQPSAEPGPRGPTTCAEGWLRVLRSSVSPETLHSPMAGPDPTTLPHSSANCSPRRTTTPPVTSGSRSPTSCHYSPKQLPGSSSMASTPDFPRSPPRSTSC